MTHDEFLIDILERTYKKVEDLDGKVDRIEIQQALHDKVVEDHSARSTASEARLDLLESSVEQRITLLEKRDNFRSNAVTILIALAAITTFVLQVLPRFLAH